MKSQKQLLAQNIAFLMLVPPESKLAKLLQFCLATTVTGEHPGKTAAEMARELMEKPSSLAYWAQDVMRIDGKYSPEEWKALANMELKDIDEFINTMLEELESLNF